MMALVPHKVEDLTVNTHVLDIAAGDSHCLALTDDCQVSLGMGFISSTKVYYCKCSVFQRKDCSVMIHFKLCRFMLGATIQWANAARAILQHHLHDLDELWD